MKRMMGYSNYIPLRVHTEYGAGSSSCEEYAVRISEIGSYAIGIVDNNFYGACDFYSFFKDKGFKLITGAEVEKPFKCIVYFENEKGYINYSRLLSDKDFEKEGLIFIVFDIRNYEKLNNENVPVYYGVEHPDSFYPEGVKIIAVPKILYARKEDIYIHSIIDSIRQKRIFKVLNIDNHLKANEEMRRFPEDSLRNTFELAERINFSPFEKPLVFLSSEKDNEELYDFIKGKNLKDEELKRAEYEFKIIREKNISGYFILVKNLSDFLTEKNIMSNVRGSAAGSFILYLFGISRVNPVRFKIPFERFLNTGRDDLPDIDIDVDFRRRDEVFEFIKRMKGKEFCGFVSVVNRFELRSSIRMIERIIGFPPSILGNKEILDQEIKELSLRIVGKPSYISRHPSAIALSDKKVYERIPVREEDGFYVLNGDKDAVEKMGFIKLDILGVRGFSALINLKKTDDIYDENVFNAISEGKTIGAFQIESPPMRQLLMKMKPETIEELGIALALIRPGAKDGGYKEHYLLRRLNKEEVRYPEILKDTLSETLGVFIYQEQAIETLKVFAGFTDNEAERYRRILTKERGKETEKLKGIFFERAKKLGRENIEEVWERLENFTRYGFNKAHSISYAYLAYLSMFSKIYTPLEFFKGVLNGGGGYYPYFAIIEEARRCGIDVILPDINESEWGFKIKDNKLLTGLGFIKFIKENTYKKIAYSRPFRDFCDFLKKVNPDERECEYIIKSGAFDSFNISREEMFSLLYTGKKFKGELKNDYFLQEMEALAFSRYHPVLNIERNMRIIDIEDDVQVYGRVIGMRVIYTMNGKKMCFLTIDDETGVIEVVLFPYILEGLNINIGDIVFVKGFYERDNFSVRCEEVSPFRYEYYGSHRLSLRKDSAT